MRGAITDISAARATRLSREEFERRSRRLALVNDVAAITSGGRGAPTQLLRALANEVRRLGGRERCEGRRKPRLRALATEALDAAVLHRQRVYEVYGRTHAPCADYLEALASELLLSIKSLRAWLDEARALRSDHKKVDRRVPFPVEP